MDLDDANQLGDLVVDALMQSPTPEEASRRVLALLEDADIDQIGVTTGGLLAVAATAIRAIGGPDPFDELRFSVEEPRRWWQRRPRRRQVELEEVPGPVLLLGRMVAATGRDDIPMAYDLWSGWVDGDRGRAWLILGLVAGFAASMMAAAPCTCGNCHRPGAS